MKDKFNVDWLRATIIRVVRTMAQTALGFLTVGAAVSEIDWTQLFSVSFIAGLYSFLTCVGGKVPESANDGSLSVDPDTAQARLDITKPIGNKKQLTFKIKQPE